jgi:hypothetical protein
MMTFEMPIEAKTPNWNQLVLGNLPGTFTDSEFQLIWAIDSEKRIILANEAYKRFVYELTGEKVKINDHVLPKFSDDAMRARWDSFYTRALRGEKFNVITNYLLIGEPVMINASFIPIVESNNIMGTACVARNPG